MHGHTHRANIEDNVIAVGHNIEHRPGYCVLDMANWSVADGIVNSDGTNQLLRMTPSGWFSNIHQTPRITTALRKNNKVESSRRVLDRDNKAYTIIQLSDGKQNFIFATAAEDINSAIKKKKRDLKRRNGIDPKTVSIKNQGEIVAGSAKEAIAFLEDPINE